MMIKLVTILLLPLICTNSYANNKCEKNQFEELEAITKQVQGCPPPDLEEFCNDITLGSEPTNTKFGTSFEERIWAASCANINSNDLTKERVKIQDMWSKYKLTFKCGTTNLNILKYAIEEGLDKLVVMMGRKDNQAKGLTGYDLDINFIDPRDNLNVLEFVNQEIKRRDDVAGAKDHYSSKVWRSYRDKLITAGAKLSK